MFGTANILTNTITIVDKDSVPIQTYHVVYDSNIKNPRISDAASTIKMMEVCVERVKTEPEAFVAALIRQVIHVATDMYTPCGIQLPALNLVLDKRTVDKITRIVSTGDILKQGTFGCVSDLINLMITTIHACMVEVEDEMFRVKNDKIINLSNSIAIGSNVLLAAIEGAGGIYAGNKDLLIHAIKKMDIQGLIQIRKKIMDDQAFVEEIKREFFISEWKKHVRGEC